MSKRAAECTSKSESSPQQVGDSAGVKRAKTESDSDLHNTLANYEQFEECVLKGEGYTIDQRNESTWEAERELGVKAAAGIARAYARSQGMTVLDEEHATDADVKSYVLQAQVALQTMTPVTGKNSVEMPFAAGNLNLQVLQAAASNARNTTNIKRNELCVHYRTGTCRNTSQSCHYLHLTPDEAIAQCGGIKVSKHFMILLDRPEEKYHAMNKFIQFQGKKICSHYKRGSCIYDAITCPYPHVVQINPLCKPWQQGTCKFGDKCHNIHEIIEEL